MHKRYARQLARFEWHFQWGLFNVVIVFCQMGPKKFQVSKCSDWVFMTYSCTLTLTHVCSEQFCHYWQFGAGVWHQNKILQQRCANNFIGGMEVCIKGPSRWAAKVVWLTNTLAWTYCKCTLSTLAAVSLVCISFFWDKKPSWVSQ